MPFYSISIGVLKTVNMNFTTFFMYLKEPQRRKERKGGVSKVTHLMKSPKCWTNCFTITPNLI
jgi:hypothetical protein